MNFGLVREAFHPVTRKLLSRGRTLFSRKYLLYTNTAIAVTLATGGDFLNQKFQIFKKELKTIDKIRSRDIAISSLVIGPGCHYWYLFLDKWLPGVSFRILTLKVIVDLAVCAPLVVFLFLGITSLLERKSKDDIIQEIVEKGPKLFLAEIVIWPPVQYLNFFFLPTQYRVLFDSVVSFLFDIYFSVVKYGKKGRVVD